MSGTGRHATNCTSSILTVNSTFSETGVIALIASLVMISENFSRCGTEKLSSFNVSTCSPVAAVGTVASSLRFLTAGSSLDKGELSDSMYEPMELSSGVNCGFFAVGTR